MAFCTNNSTRYTIGVSILLPLVVATPLSAWECAVNLNAPRAIGVGETKTLYATGTPDGGSYSWTNLSSLVPSGSTATLTGFQPTYSDYINAGVTYTSPSGRRCSDSKYIWVYSCDVNLTGPSEIKVGEQVTYLAYTYSHSTNGTYSWNGPRGLTPLAVNDAAIFIAVEPGDTTLTVTYTDGECSKSDSHLVKVIPDCTVSITGPTEVPLTGTVTLMGKATPEGGTFTWDNVSTVVPSVGNIFAYVQGSTPGIQTVTANYTTPDGYSCAPATHDIETYAVESLTGPYCANSGDLVSKDSYTIVTAPIGYEDLVSVTPERLVLPATSMSKTEEITISGSVNPNSYTDDVTTTIVVVNPSIKGGISYSFSIPNYVNDALRALNIDNQTKLKLEQSFEQVKTCCNGTNINDTTEGKLSVILEAPPLDIRIAGIPLPKALKKYVTLDLLKLSISAGSDITITGKLDGCSSIPYWSGGGTLKAGLEVKGEVAVKTPGEVIVIEGTVSGSTDVTETLATVGSDITLTGEWGGLTAAGVIKLKLLGFFAIEPKKASKILLDQRVLSDYRIPLPSLTP